jgi:hypothetical protein
MSDYTSMAIPPSGKKRVDMNKEILRLAIPNIISNFGFLRMGTMGGDGASVWDVSGIGFFRRTILGQSRSVVVIIVVHDHERACAGDIISVR